MAEAQTKQTDRNAEEGLAKRYAVIVGVNKYTEADINPLSYCAADAEAFYDALITYCKYDPESVVLFSDGNHKNAKEPKRSDILAAISKMSICATEEDSVLFFFAGHGTRDTEDSYLLTKDFRKEVVEDTSIPMEAINNYFHKSKAKFVMRFFDACHSGRMRSRTVASEPDIEKHFLVEGEGWATISACKEDQLANEDPFLEHGIFSYCLIKGLSGEAKTDNQEVTFQSLTTYTVAKTIEITKDRGLQQTPVINECYTGKIVLATTHDNPLQQVPQTLVKVQETTVDQLKPTQEKVPQFISNIRSILQDEPLQSDYIAPSHEEKIALGDKLVQKAYQQCEEQEHRYHEQLKDLVTITIKHQSIKDCPLNLRLAEYIQSTKIKQAVGLKQTYKQERVQSNNILLNLNLFDYDTQDVLSGIRERDGYYQSAVELKIWSQESLMPVCAMVVAIIPNSFGLYLLQYACSTQIDQTQKEYWDADTFTIRTLHALPFTDTDGAQAIKELQDLYPQFISFFAQNCTARRVYLQDIGISGQSLL